MTSLLVVVLALAQTGEVKSPDFSNDMQATVLRATVRVVGNGTQGSGVIVKQDGIGAWVLTANHLTGDAKTVQIHTFSAESYPNAAKVYKDVKVFATSKEQDLAVVRIVTSDKMPGVLPLRAEKDAPTGKEEFPGLTCGCDDGKAPTCKADTVKSRKTIRRPGERKDVVCWETATAQATGRSGGPLVDKRGYVLGIASGANDDRGYFVHSKEIAAFLKDNGLDDLGEEEKK